MPRRAPTFNQADVKRAVAGAQAAGFSVQQIKLTPAGEIVLSATSAAAGDEANVDSQNYLKRFA